MKRRSPRSHPDAQSPAKALARTRQAAREGRCKILPRVYGDLAQLGCPLSEVQAAIDAALAEITEADDKRPDHSLDPPGHGFVWDSKFFGRRMYLKCRLEGRRPVCVLYSLHAAHYGARQT